MTTAPTCPNGELVTVVKEVARVDSRMLASSLGTMHKNTFAQIKAYQPDFEAFGKVLFQTEALASGQRERFALLNEDQAFLLLTFTRNTPTVRELKRKLVQAFSEARKAAQLRHCEYLPAYHELHDRLHVLAVAGGTSNERFVHSNVNQLLNKVAGIEPGQRAASRLPQQSLLIVAQALAAQALVGAPDHRAGYERIKQALAPLSTLAHIGGR
ncbi:MAG: hypothetical protein C0453_04795 [Comamonadaceae bacterium]|nr:hypothetical protein [Comamonadaceae bacterium]